MAILGSHSDHQEELRADMAIIAVAGGSSPTLGRVIVAAIRAGKNTPVILSRKVSEDSTRPVTRYGVPVRYVDYSSHDSLVAALRDVETVISVTKIPGLEWSSQQITLLKAAAAAGVKRFAPSEFEAGPGAQGMVDVTAQKGDVWAACEASGLECARFCNGMFMNYLALGTEREKELSQGLIDWPIIWDVGKRRAELPIRDDGRFPRITLTEIEDIGKFVAAACELPLGRWEKTMGMVGQTIGVDEVLNILEESSGCKWSTTTITETELKKRAAEISGVGKNRTEIVEKLVAQMELMILQDKEDMGQIRPTVNRLCSHQPQSVQSFVAKVFQRSL